MDVKNRRPLSCRWINSNWTSPWRNDMIKNGFIAGAGIALCLLTGAGISRAEEPAAERDYDRFDLRVGGGWVFGADTTVSLIGSRGVGAVIDYDKTLDGKTSNSLFRVDGTWNINKHHSLNYTWYDVNRTGLRTLDRDIQFGDTDFPIGASIDSQLDIKLSRFLYRYGLARTD